MKPTITNLSSRPAILNLFCPGPHLSVQSYKRAAVQGHLSQDLISGVGGVKSKMYKTRSLESAAGDFSERPNRKMSRKPLQNSIERPFYAPQSMCLKSRDPLKVSQGTRTRRIWPCYALATAWLRTY
uniref:Uncharacterized protein n=1 Tax=Cacopsylla melanoneura TaxID=428564 RepID=A0A8D8UH32_9HEMI